MPRLTDWIKRHVYRTAFFADVPGLMRRLKFKQLRRTYYKAYWERAGKTIGATVSPVCDGFIRIRSGNLETLVRDGEVMLDSHLTLEIMGNKPLVYSLMSEHGLSVPDHRVFDMSTLEIASEFLTNQTGHVVVKPARGTGGGRGVTTGVQTRAELKSASRLAARYCEHLTVEEQIEGHSYRLLYLNGEFVDAVRRDRPVIRGDGRRTIRQLLVEENKKRLQGTPVTALSPLQLDRDCLNYLRQQGMSASNRPGDGIKVTLKRAINENTASQNHRVRKTLHKQTIDDIARLVRDLGVHLAGVDIICRDIELPLGSDNGFVTEINTTPGLHHHDLIAPSDDQFDVGAYVLKHMFATQNGTMRLPRRRSQNVTAMAPSSIGTVAEL